MIDVYWGLLYVLVFFCFGVVNPVFMSLMVMLFAMMTSFFIYMFTWGWFYYVLMLVFLGGVMVIFVYTSSLVCSEKFYVKFSGVNLFILVFSASLISKKDRGSGVMGMVADDYEFVKVFNYYGGESLMILTIILLVTMLMVVKMVQVFSGPLKWKF